MLVVVVFNLVTITFGREQTTAKATFWGAAAMTVTMMSCNGAASPGVLTCVAAADVNGQGARGAERGGSAVNHQDGQEVHVLLVAVEARALHPDTSCVV